VFDGKEARRRVSAGRRGLALAVLIQNVRRVLLARFLPEV